MQRVSGGAVVTSRSSQRWEEPCDWLQRVSGGAVVSFDQAVVLGKHGGPRVKGEQPDNVRLEYGNRADYTVARLRRDHPELALTP